MQKRKESDVMNMKQAKLIEEVTQIATLKAIEVFNAQKEEELQREKDKRLYNTKLLLKHYHTFRKYVEDAKEDVEPETPIQKLILNEKDIVESVRATTERTVEMVKHLDRAMDALAYICEREETKHYEILHKRFVEGLQIPIIADEYEINNRTVYKLIDTAAERLATLLFGVYGLKIE
ncbi:hypothetical protein [Lysinibacillus sphaericus]|uniref:hypothetical protein n=1 Tax=Lysinibacillus sphaericus TaxID=1421 RepID=UPI003D7F7C6D